MASRINYFLLTFALSIVVGMIVVLSVPAKRKTEVIHTVLHYESGKEFQVRLDPAADTLPWLLNPDNADSEAQLAQKYRIVNTERTVNWPIFGYAFLKGFVLVWLVCLCFNFMAGRFLETEFRHSVKSLIKKRRFFRLAVRGRALQPH